jgi:hemerythrin-like metal-binding protein
MLLAWSPALSVGVLSIDDEHKQLIKVANDLHDAMKQGKAQSQLGAALKELVDYTGYHFEHEEGQMAKYSYPKLAEHQAEHHDLFKTVEDLQARQRAGESCLTVQVFEFLKNWLMGHIQRSDKAFGTWLSDQGALTESLAARSG